MKKERRELTKNILLGLTVVPTLSLISQSAKAANSGESTLVIKNPHGHAVDIPLADLLNLALTGQKLVFDIKGRSSHNHKLEITADDLETLALNSTVQLTTSSDRGHSHTIVLSLGSVGS